MSYVSNEEAPTPIREEKKIEEVKKPVFVMKKKLVEKTEIQQKDPK